MLGFKELNSEEITVGIILGLGEKEDIFVLLEFKDILLVRFGKLKKIVLSVESCKHIIILIFFPSFSLVHNISHLG